MKCLARLMVCTYMLCKPASMSTPLPRPRPRPSTTLGSCSSILKLEDPESMHLSAPQAMSTCCDMQSFHFTFISFSFHVLFISCNAALQSIQKSAGQDDDDATLMLIKKDSAAARLGLACCDANAGQTPTYKLTMQCNLCCGMLFVMQKPVHYRKHNIVKLAALVHAQCCKVPCLNDGTDILMISSSSLF